MLTSQSLGSSLICFTTIKECSLTFTSQLLTVRKCGEFLVITKTAISAAYERELYSHLSLRKLVSSSGIVCKRSVVNSFVSLSPNRPALPPLYLQTMTIDFHWNKSKYLSAQIRILHAIWGLLASWQETLSRILSTKTLLKMKLRKSI